MEGGAVQEAVARQEPSAFLDPSPGREVDWAPLAPAAGAEGPGAALDR